MPLAPGGEGLLGHNAAFRKNRMRMMRLLARQEHPILRLDIPFPGVHAAMALDPDIVQEVLVEKNRSFVKSDMLRFGLYELGGEGLFTSNGDLWKRQRRTMAPLFTPRALEAYAEDMVACAERTVAGWRDGGSLSLSHETTRLTMGVAGKTLFDADTFSEADEIGEALTVALEWTGWIIGRPLAVGHIAARRAAESLARRTTGRLHDAAVRAERRLTGPLFLPGKRGRGLREAIRFLDDHVQKMIDQRRGSAAPHPDLLTRLLEAKDEDGATMSDRQVRDEVLTLFIAGHETTATGLAWTLYHAGRDPELYRAMEREADLVGERPGVEDLPRLGLCLRAFKEALRVAPPVYVFGRDSIEPVTIGGYDLPWRTNIMLAPWALHHQARLWPEPDRFDPARFLPEHEAGRHRYAYLPFGAGPRICLGNHFAYMEAQLTLAVLLKRFRFEILGADEPDPGATLRPKHGIRVRVHRREPARVAVATTPA